MHVEIPEEFIGKAASHYAMFAFDEGMPGEMLIAKDCFNKFVSEAYVTLTKTALMGGFHRPTAGEFRAEFISQCRKYLRRHGKM